MTNNDTCNDRELALVNRLDAVLRDMRAKLDNEAAERAIVYAAAKNGITIRVQIIALSTPHDAARPLIAKRGD